MFPGYWMLIRKFCKYLCAPANITEDTVAISQRFHVWKYEKFTPWKIHTTNKGESRKCGSFAKPKFRDGSTRNEIQLSTLRSRITDSVDHVISSCHEVHERADVTLGLKTSISPPFRKSRFTWTGMSIASIMEGRNQTWPCRCHASRCDAAVFITETSVKV
jgi:hypothetical protein